MAVYLIRMTTFYKLAGVVGSSVKKAAEYVQSRIVVTDDELVAKSINGDDEAFTELVRRYQDFIIRLATGYLHDREHGKDAAQETFVKAYQGLPYLKKSVQFNSWLFRICKNHCINILRRQKLENNFAPTEMKTAEPAVLAKYKLKQLIAGLEIEYRDVLILRYYQDMRYQEIADILNLPISTVKIRLHRAKKMLREAMEELPYELR